MVELEATLKELGDLSGIIHDLNSDELIGGNQRSNIMNLDDCEIELVKKIDIVKNAYYNNLDKFYGIKVN